MYSGSEWKFEGRSGRQGRKGEAGIKKREWHKAVCGGEVNVGMGDGVWSGGGTTGTWAVWISQSPLGRGAEWRGETHLGTEHAGALLEQVLCTVLVAAAQVEEFVPTT